MDKRRANWSKISRLEEHNVGHFSVSVEEPVPKCPRREGIAVSSFLPSLSENSSNSTSETNIKSKGL